MELRTDSARGTLFALVVFALFSGALICVGALEATTSDDFLSAAAMDSGSPAVDLSVDGVGSADSDGGSDILPTVGSMFPARLLFSAGRLVEPPAGGDSHRNHDRSLYLLAPSHSPPGV